MMVRTAVRSTTAQPLPRAETAVELLDRTGIIAASLPQRRRTECESEAGPMPAHESRAMDHRPRSVVIRRRAKAWIGAAAGVGLLVVGWLAGGTFGPQSSDTASPVDVRQGIADRPVTVAPVVPPTAPTTATQVLKVPDPRPVVTHRSPATAKAKPRRAAVAAQPSVEPRVDLQTASSWTRKSQQFAFSEQMKGLVLPLVSAMSGR
jgi:hypothetical protein